MSDALFIPDDRLCDYLDDGRDSLRVCRDCGTPYSPNAGQEECPRCCPTEDDDDETEDRP